MDRVVAATIHSNTKQEYQQMYIYVFKNSTTNKKYIGYTTQDISKYKGSGKYWVNHCKTNGGHCKSNIETLQCEWFDNKEDAISFLDQFEKDNPEYWKSNKWCNLVRETLEDSALRGNMDDIFNRNGNPFSGGEIQRKAHAEGKHNYDRNESVKKGWKHRDRKKAAQNMHEGFGKWKEENQEYFLSEQRRKLELAQEAARLKRQKLKYKGEVYYGWAELERATGISKWFLKKNNEVIIL